MKITWSGVIWTIVILLAISLSGYGAYRIWFKDKEEKSAEEPKVLTKSEANQLLVEQAVKTKKDADDFIRETVKEIYAKAEKKTEAAAEDLKKAKEDLDAKIKKEVEVKTKAELEKLVQADNPFAKQKKDLEKERADFQKEKEEYEKKKEGEVDALKKKAAIGEATIELIQYKLTTIMTTANRKEVMARLAEMEAKITKLVLGK